MVAVSPGPPPPPTPPVAGYSLYLYAPYVGNTSTDWVDHSGFGRDATVSGGTPALVAGAVDGKAAYQLGSGNIMATPAYDCPASTTVFVVTQPIAFNNKQGILGSYDGASVASYALSYGGSKGFGAYLDNSDTNTTPDAHAIGGGADNASTMVIGGRMDASLANGVSQTLMFNSAFVAWGTAPAPADAPTSTRYVGQAPNISGTVGDFYVCAVIEYPFALSDAQMTSVSNFLASHFAVTVPLVDPSYATTNGSAVSVDLLSNTVYVVGTDVRQYDADTGTLLGTSSASVGGTGTQVVSDGTSVWFSDFAGLLYKAPIATFPSATTFSRNTAPQCFDGNFVWGTGPSGHISSIDPSGAATVHAFTHTVIPGGMIYYGGYVWILSSTGYIGGTNALYQYDPINFVLVNTTTFTAQPTCFCAGFGGIWVGFVNSDIKKCSATNGAVLTTFDFTGITVGPSSAGLGQWVGCVWNNTNFIFADNNGRYLELTPTGAVVQVGQANAATTFPNPGGPVAWTGAYLWSAEVGNNGVVRFLQGAPPKTLPVVAPAIWLDATDPNNVPGAWYDKSRNGFDAIVQAGSNPVIATASLNGLTAYQFTNAAGTQMETPGTLRYYQPSSAGGKGGATFVVFKSSSVAVRGGPVGTVGYTSGDTLVYSSSYGGVEAWIDGTDILQGGTANTNPHIMHMTLDAAGNMQAFLDGVSVGTATGVVASASPYGYQSLGFYSFTGATMTGLIGEFIRFDRALSPTELTNQYNELAAKWGI